MFYKILRILFGIIYNIAQILLFASVAGLYPRSRISKIHGIPFTVLFIGWAIYLFVTWIATVLFFVIPHHSRHVHRKEQFHRISASCEYRNVSMFLFGGYLIAMMQIRDNTILCVVSYLMLFLLLVINEIFVYLINHDPTVRENDKEKDKEIDVELPRELEEPVKTKARFWKASKKQKKEEESYEYSYYSSEHRKEKTTKEKTTSKLKSFFRKKK